MFCISGVVFAFLAEVIHRLVAVHFRQDDVTLMNISVQIDGWMVSITDNEKGSEASCNLYL